MGRLHSGLSEFLHRGGTVATQVGRLLRIAGDRGARTSTAPTDTRAREPPMVPDGGTSRSSDLGRYERIVEAMGDGVYALDPSGEIAEVNDRLLELTGYDRDEMIGAHPRLFLDEADVPVFESAIQDLLDGESDVETVESAILTADDEEIPIEVTLTLRTDEDGEFRGTVGSVRDVTQRKKRERELERYETLLNTIPDTVTVTDLDGNHADIHGFEGWSGYEREELIGEPIEKTTPEKYVERGEEAVRELFTNEDVDKVTYESAVVTKDGEAIPHENHITLLPADEDGQVSGTLSVLRDISDRKERERQLEALNEMMRELVTAASPEEIAEIVVESASDVLGLDVNLVVLHDADEDVLRPVAASTAAEELLDDFSPFEPGEIPWQAFETGEIQAYEDVSSAEGSRDPDGPLRNGLVCPLGEHGVVLLGSTDDGVFDDRDLSIAENLAGNVEAAMDRAKKQQALVARERDLELYELAVESTRDGIAVVDEETEYLVVNGMFAEATGFSKDDLEGARMVDVDDSPIVEAPDDLAERWQRAAEEAAEAGESEFRFETEVELEQGHVVLDSRVTAVRRDDGSVVFVMVSRDVTDRKEIERQMEQLHESTRNLMTADSTAEVAEKVLEAVESTLGISGSLVRLAEDSQLVPVAVTDEANELLEDPEARPIANDPLGDAFTEGEAIRYDDIRKADGDYDDANYRTLLSQPIGDFGLLSIVDDEVGAFDEADMRITEVLAANVEAAFERVEREEALREREQALARQNERLDEFAGIVSHDLRNPLNVAKGHLAFAQENIEDDEHLDEVDHALDRMDDIINDVLTLTREGEQASTIEPVGLDATVDACWRNVDTSDAVLSLETDRVILADESRLQQLLENLFRNAIEHVGEDVSITVGDVDGGFYVEDDGPGIPPEDRERVFEAGFTDRSGGTGLGLNIVETIAEDHGWTATVTEGSDGGARFEFTGVDVPDE